MKKGQGILCCLLAAVLSMTLPACGKKNPETPGGSTAAESRKLGVGCAAARTMDGTNKTVIKATAAAVELAADGTIAACRLDEVEFAVILTEGKPGDVAELRSKGELGELYTLTEADTGGKTEHAGTWRQQADAFCAYVKGKTAAEVSGIAATDGKNAEITGCDLVITDFIKAVRRAADHALAVKSGGGDTLHLALLTRKNADSTDEKPHYDVEIAAVSMNGSKITACFTDTLQAKLTIENAMFSTVSGEIETKRTIGDAYGMKKASSIQKEWYEQADAFDAYAVGKTADELAAVKLGSDGKTDAISGCTIEIGGMLEATVKAARTA